MRLWALLAALLLSTLVLAGCSDDDGDGDDTSSSTSSTTRASTSRPTTAPAGTTSASTPTQPPTDPPRKPDNTAPIGSIAAAPGNATLPRSINFTLNGTDPEGDNIVWDLTYGDGNATQGATLPANATHQYAAAGRYNVTFTISDGRLQTIYNLTANVTTGAGGAVLFTLVGSTVAPNPFLSAPVPELGPPGAFMCFGYTASPNPAESTSGLDCIFSALPPGLAGTFTATSSLGDSEVEFWDSCDPAMGATAEGGYFFGAGEATGAVPAGAGCVIMWDAADAADLTFTVVG